MSFSLVVNSDTASFVACKDTKVFFKDWVFWGDVRYSVHLLLRAKRTCIVRLTQHSLRLRRHLKPTLADLHDTISSSECASLLLF